jgi:hypothetical protein
MENDCKTRAQCWARTGPGLQPTGCAACHTRPARPQPGGPVQPRKRPAAWERGAHTGRPRHGHRVWFTCGMVWWRAHRCLGGSWTMARSSGEHQGAPWRAPVGGGNGGLTGEIGRRAGAERRRRGGAQRWWRHSDGCGGSEVSYDVRTRGMRMTRLAEDETAVGAAHRGRWGMAASPARIHSVVVAPGARATLLGSRGKRRGSGALGR